MEQKFKDFLAKYNNQYVERVDANALNQLFDIWYNNYMKKFNIVSKTHGKFTVLLDDEDYKKIRSLGKWNVHKVRDLFYAQKRIGEKIMEMHRYITGAKKGEYVDHINHNTLDNRRCNIRVTTNAANLRNGRLRKNNKSGNVGVGFYFGKWYAGIKVNYKRINLGTFKSKSQAIEARKQAEKLYWNI